MLVVPTARTTDLIGVIGVSRPVLGRMHGPYDSGFKWKPVGDGENENESHLATNPHSL